MPFNLPPLGKGRTCPSTCLPLVRGGNYLSNLPPLGKGGIISLTCLPLVRGGIISLTCLPLVRGGIKGGDCADRIYTIIWNTVKRAKHFDFDMYPENLADPCRITSCAQKILSPSQLCREGDNTQTSHSAAERRTYPRRRRY